MSGTLVDTVHTMSDILVGKGYACGQGSRHVRHLWVRITPCPIFVCNDHTISETLVDKAHTMSDTLVDKAHTISDTLVGKDHILSGWCVGKNDTM